jgi:hypothetical protein
MSVLQTASYHAPVRRSNTSHNRTYDSLKTDRT